MTDAHPADDRTQAVYQRAGFVGGFQWGERPVVVVVDLCCGFTDPVYPLGSESGEVLERTRTVLDAARGRAVPVVFTTFAYEEGARTRVTWLRKVPSLADLTPGSAQSEIDPRLGRRQDEVLLAKQGASAFFGTPLHAMLVAERTDSVIVLGATTSGCVRASVTDSVQHGFPTFVVTDCCVDRAAGPHEANLFDMTAKYADPRTGEEVVSYLQALPARARN
jgi:maleamate amidohydrolase